MSSINVLGAACIDLLLSNIDRDRFFSGKYKVQQMRSSFGGDGLNQAVDLTRLGNDVSFSFIAGKDPYGTLIRSFLEQEGIHFADACFKDGIDTYVSLVMIEADGEHCFVGSENGSLRLYDLSDVSIDEDCCIASFASLFISKAFDTDKYSSLFKQIKGKGIILCVDTSTPKNDEDARELPYLKYIDYFFCNETEGLALTHTDDIYRCEEILYGAGAKNVIIKLGAKGALYKGEIYPPAEKIMSIDSTGAGDAFVSGFIHYLHQGKDIEACIRFANECGAKACRYLGGNEWSRYIHGKEV